MIKISIVTVAKNAQTELIKTAASVAKQTYGNIEYIIIDGSSTDGTTDWLSNNSGVADVMVSEPDNGLYDAMNKGKAIASGDYLLFLNSGDQFVDDNCLELISNAIGNSNGILPYAKTILYFGKEKAVAPAMHHQAVFYPVDFYKSYDYRDTELRVIAERDFTATALNSFTPFYIDCAMVLSNYSGWGVSQYASIKGTIGILKEHRILFKSHSEKYSFLYKIFFPIKCFTKYLLFKIGGIELASTFVLKGLEKY